MEMFASARDPSFERERTPFGIGKSQTVSFLLGAVCLLTLLRLVSLVCARTDLYFDEAQYWAWSQNLAFGYFSKPPLVAWIIRGTTMLLGDAEFAVRAASPLLHGATALVIFSCGKALYGREVGVLSGLSYLTVPGVALSSTVISTDGPLLFFWAIALRAWIGFYQSPGLAWAAVLGAALGLGFLAKYAMLYFLLCAALHLALAKTAREPMRVFPLLAALALALMLAAPNIVWNMTNDLMTLRHTVANADWNGFHPVRAGEFFLAQFGVFGPILFGALVLRFALACGRTAKVPDENERLFLCFSLPILLLLLGQAFASRAQAHWAATAYPAATILVVAWLNRSARGPVWLMVSLVLHGAISVVMLLAHPMAPSIKLPAGIHPFGRLLGWKELADKIGATASRERCAQILTHDRAMAAELTYYLRDSSTPVTAWHHGPVPEHYFAAHAPFRPELTPALLAASRPGWQKITESFTTVDALPEVEAATGQRSVRRVLLFRLTNYRGHREEHR